MSSSPHDYIQKGIQNAERATEEDKAHNYEAAIKNYMAAAECLMHAVKYGAMNEQLKQNIRAKVSSYIKRAEEIKATSKNGDEKKKAVTDGGNPKDNKDDDDGDDPDRKRMMRKFEGAIVTDPQVSFSDVVGLEQAKEALKEAVILPVKFPQLFQGKRKPWAGILLYGPPGTGKSYLAKAIATECKSTFISVSSSDLLSKWLGESEKGVKCLFEVSRERQPCIVFIDEIDALCGQRNDTESESSRRVKTEFLVQMQGVGTDNAGVLVLAATNIPWALDTAIRRRFEKRIYIPLPGVNERAAMFKTHLGTSSYHTIKEHEWLQLAHKSDHYSGADIAVVCREALLRPIRRLGSATHFKRVQNPSPNGPRLLWLACSPGDTDAVELKLDGINSEELCEPPVTISDMVAALSTQKPTVGESDLLLQKKFTEEFGQEGS
ncbi:unnamed protein product [Rotaria socialis]|uniref:Vesicle-fusing ATPase n=1 Tax=Rotaria socialis TaxID=392032 RepID=A0A817WY32_9BILA|nr:unnamed protein product [Rotaria socialis]CAF4753153.1 unnamed protein product [Rotaria socialis]